ncbi:Sodium/potassium/calcium exchanger 2 [Durusdinium trenchii]|uniref:Sodium/potassium/calcium exchanger 2 n=1 Tax=Durusdinium trenchii TaxID=1381693 RepID=A0ABP0P9L5_9DINO
MLEDANEVTFTSMVDLANMRVAAECKAHQDHFADYLRMKKLEQAVWAEHQLAYFVQECCKAIMKGEADEAQNGLDILTMQLDSEEKMIAAAFNKFDTDGSGKLAGSEVQFMLDYLGFPDSQDDVAKITKVLDWGGSSKLFEVRRKQIQERSDFTGSAHDPERLRILLQESGISPEAQAHWRLTASESELDSAAAMRPCQQAAIRHIRHLAEENHIRALPQLQERVKKLGYTDTDLHMVLAWIRELAPIIVHINLDKVGKFFVEDNRREIKTPWCPYKPLVYVPRVLDGAKSDSHYRNQFETNTSGGLLKTSAREKWERGLFGTAYDGAHAFERPKYGVQNIWNDHRGVVGAKQYGDSYIVLKDVRLRCTLSPQDSANLPARRLAVLDYYAHVLLEQ